MEVLSYEADLFFFSICARFYVDVEKRMLVFRIIAFELITRMSLNYDANICGLLST